MQGDPWVQRIERARKLAAERPAVADILLFYAGLAACQRTLAARANERACEDRAFGEAIDLDTASRAVPVLLRWLEDAAPAPLAAAAASAASLDAARWADLMRRFVMHEEIDTSLGFIVEAVLQPFAEAAASALREHHHETPHQGGVPKSRCPVCGSLPAVGVLREEGHGARRTLVCSFCFTEWAYLRVVCPACNETQFDALPIYRAEAFEQTRLDACDTCRIYLKTIDLTRDGLADPMADDLATLALDVWARDRGYSRLRPNLLRV